MKEKKKISLENLLFFLNILIIIGIILLYFFRAIYYYKKTNYVPKSENLYSNIVNLKNIINYGDGLYELEGEKYYYKGSDVSNYILYSDVLWRIVDVSKDGIKIVAEDNQTSLVWGINTDYENSYVNQWLNDKYLNGLYQKEEYINKYEWCNEKVDINNYNCENKITNYVGLLSTEEYIRAGGKNSYLNNESFWWTVNISNPDEVIYVNDSGEIDNKSKNNDSYYSYGVRPVIVLNSNTNYIGGNGTKEDPYIIENNIDIEINNHSIGTYLSYKGYNWRVMEINDEYTKVILDGYIMDENGEVLKLDYQSSKEYLTNEFLSKLNLEDLVKIDFYYGTYDETNNYNYDISSQNKENNYISFPNIGELHITDYSMSWLNNEYTSDQKLIYISTDAGSIFADFSTSTNYIRPVICIKKGLIISGGTGTKQDPLIIGDNK